MDWKAYYDARVPAFDPADYLGQVGHTVNGAPIPQDHLAALRDQIAALLELGPQDRLLDLCCGNGLFTHPLAGQVAQALGADISSEMIRVARSDHPAPNLAYAELDARRAATLSDRPEAPFSRVLIYGAWQHFDTVTGAEVLSGLAAVTAADVRILLGFVPDVALKDRFFDTPERRAAHAAHVAAGNDMFGTWWDRETLSDLAAAHGFACTFADLPPMVQAARYRFHALLARA